MQQNALQQKDQIQWLLEFQMPIADICVLAQLNIMQDVFVVKTGIFCIADVLINAGAFAEPLKKVQVRNFRRSKKC